MIYNVFGGTLSLTQSINQSIMLSVCVSVRDNILKFMNTLSYKTTSENFIKFTA